MTKFIILLSVLSSMFGITQQGFEQEWLENELAPLAHKLAEVTGVPESRVLFEIFGPLHFQLIETGEPYISCWSSLTCYGNIEAEIAHGLLLHELGHRFINDTGKTGSELADYSLGYYEDGDYIHISGYNPTTGKYERTLRGQPFYKNNLDLTYREDYADMFMSWALDNFSLDKAGQIRYNYINEFIQDRVKELGYGKNEIRQISRKFGLCGERSNHRNPRNPFLGGNTTHHCYY